MLDFSCTDWRDRLRDGRSLVPFAPPDPQEAARAVAIFDRLRLPDVDGRPTLGDAAGDWFRDIVAVLFGSYDPETALRLVCDVFLLVPKKNSKTTNGAALMLVALLFTSRPMARFGLFGPTQEISEVAFLAATGMIAADPDLSNLLHVQDHLKTITRRDNSAVLKVTTFDPSVATGGKYAGWLLDEAHLLSKVAYADRVIRQLRGARAAIHESFGVIITTQSDVPPAGAFKAELQYARSVRDGRAPSSGFLPVLYEFPEEIQTDKSQPWLDPSTWSMVLPNLGRSISLAALERDLVAEREKGPQALSIWASQHLNIELGLALHNERWRGADWWLDRADRTMSLAELLARCEAVTVGIDGGGLDDLLSLSVIGREKGGRRWLHWGRSWVDRSILVERPAIAASLVDFERDGDLVFVDIAPADPDPTEAGAVARGAAPGERPADPSYLDDLVAIVAVVNASGLLPDKAGIGLDPAGVAAIVDALMTIDGLDPECLVAVAQTWKLSGVIHGVAIRLKAGTFVHSGQRLVAWAVGNAKIELRGSALSITKQTAGAAKIDPLMSLFDAAELMARNPQARAAASVWEGDDYELRVM